MIDRNRQRVKQINIPKPSYWWRLQPIQLVAIDVGDWLWTFVIVNLLWFILSLTIILLPSATAALYEVALQAYRGQSPSPRAYLVSVRRWLFKAWIWAAINGLLIIVIAAALSFYNAQNNGIGDFLLTFTVLTGLLITAAQFYFWPYMVIQQQPKIRLALRNSLFTVMGDPFLLLVNGIIILIVLPVGIVLIAPMLLILPVVLSMLSTYSLLLWLARRGLIEEEEREI